MSVAPVALHIPSVMIIDIMVIYTLNRDSVELERICPLLSSFNLLRFKEERKPGEEGEKRHVPPCGSAGKESTCNAGEPGSNTGSGRSAVKG